MLRDVRRALDCASVLTSDTQIAQTVVGNEVYNGFQLSALLRFLLIELPQPV